MALDAALLALLGRELEQTLKDARVDKIFEPTRDEIVLHLRTRTQVQRLLLSARSGSARVCITHEIFENPAVPPSFCMLLRKHFIGGRLIEVRVIEDERILLFDFQCINEMGDSVVNTIAAELMGRYSNLVLYQKENSAFPEQEGKIIDALKRVGFDDSKVRHLLPGLRYTLPPKPDKLSFIRADAAAIVQTLQLMPQLPSAAMTKAMGGVGPVVCREAVFRALGELFAAANELTEQQMGALVRTIADMQQEWSRGGVPVMVVRDGEPIEFSFIKLMQYQGAELRVFGSYSELLEGYYAAKDQTERVRQKSRELARAVKNLYERAVRKAAARRQELEESRACEQLRIYGEVLNAHLWELERGMSTATLLNYYTNEPIEIPLDIRLSPAQNAQRYFKEYKKKQTAARILTGLIEESDMEAAYLETVCYEVETARGEAALNEIRMELKAQGYLKYFKIKDKKHKPADFWRYESSDGFEILVGRNNVQNDRLTLKMARGRDLWFHVQKAPGSHVVVFSQGREIPNRTKEEAAMLAAVHSSAYSSEMGGVKVAVDYTFIRNVWKANGAKPGMVLYDGYETAYVTPREDLKEQLLKKE